MTTAEHTQFVSATDQVELSQLITEHLYRIDNGLAGTLYELYAEDGVLDIGTGTLRGHEAIREWGRELAENPPWRIIRHVAGDMRFVADGPDVARGIIRLVVFMDPDGTAPSVPWNVGEDHDRFVRTADGWRIASHRWVGLFDRGDTVDIP